MADGVKVTIRRKDQLYAKLRRLAPEIEKGLAEAARKSAEEMVNTAKNYVPVESGRLRAAITYEMLGNGIGARVFINESADFYAHFAEFGTINHPAQPFFFPAYRLGRRRMRARFGRVINAAVKKVAGR